MPFFSKCRNSGNNGRNCTIFGAQGDLGGPFDFSRFGLGVTSRDLSMALPVLQTFLCKCPLGLFHKSIVFYDTKKLVYFTIKSFPENDRKKCCTNKILNLEVS